MRMRRRIALLLSAALACALLAVVLPEKALAEEKVLDFSDPDDPTHVTYGTHITIEPDGAGWKATNSSTFVVVTGAMTDSLRIKASAGRVEANGTIVVDGVGTGETPLLLTLDGLPLVVNDASAGSPLALTAYSNVKLTVLRDSVFWQIETGLPQPAIEVPENATLAISGPGKLTATTSSGCTGAVIGSKSGANCGTIRFDDANVEATSGGTNVAIGGAGGTIYFTGGTVTAAGGNNGTDCPAIDADSVSILPAAGKALATRVSDFAVSDWSTVTPAITAHANGVPYQHTERYAQISEYATVKVEASPAGSVTTGTPVTLTAALTNITNPTYQWYRNTADSLAGGEIILDDANGASYQSLTSTAGTTYYYCIVGGISGVSSGIPSNIVAVKRGLRSPLGLTLDAASGNWDDDIPNYRYGFTVQLYKGGTGDANKVGGPADVAVGTRFYSFYSAMQANGQGTYYFKVKAKGDGGTIADSAWATSPAFNYIAPPITVTPTSTFQQNNAPSNLTLGFSVGSGVIYDRDFGSLEIGPDGTNFSTVPAANYSVVEDPIRITLDQGYLNALTPGVYQFRVNLASGFVGLAPTATVTVTAGPTPTMSITPAARFPAGNAGGNRTVTISCDITGFNATNNFESASLGTHDLRLGTIGGAGGADGSIRDGSIVITLNAAYLNTLQPGGYPLTVRLRGGYDPVTTEIVVTAAPASVPKTGDNTPLLLLCTLASLSGAGLLVSRTVRKRKEER